MKRSHSDVDNTLTTIPQFVPGSSQTFKSNLDGFHKLRVIKVTDISKPAHKPIDEVEEPEEADVALENKLNRNNARMFQLDLRDAEDKGIRALETEHLSMLDNVKPDCIVNINGPVDIRCGNIMLEKRHLIGVEIAPKKEDPPPQPAPKEVKKNIIMIDLKDEDWDDEDENDCICLD